MDKKKSKAGKKVWLVWSEVHDEGDHFYHVSYSKKEALDYGDVGDEVFEAKLVSIGKIKRSIELA